MALQDFTVIYNRVPILVRARNKRDAIKRVVKKECDGKDGSNVLKSEKYLEQNILPELKTLADASETIYKYQDLKACMYFLRYDADPQIVECDDEDFIETIVDYSEFVLEKYGTTFRRELKRPKREQIHSPAYSRSAMGKNPEKRVAFLEFWDRYYNEYFDKESVSETAKKQAVKKDVVLSPEDDRTIDKEFDFKRKARAKVAKKEKRKTNVGARLRTPSPEPELFPSQFPLPRDEAGIEGKRLIDLERDYLRRNEEDLRLRQEDLARGETSNFVFGQLERLPTLIEQSKSKIAKLIAETQPQRLTTGEVAVPEPAPEPAPEPVVVPYSNDTEILIEAFKYFNVDAKPILANANRVPNYFKTEQFFTDLSNSQSPTVISIRGQGPSFRLPDRFNTEYKPPRETTAEEQTRRMIQLNLADLIQRLNNEDLNYTKEQRAELEKQRIQLEKSLAEGEPVREPSPEPFIGPRELQKGFGIRRLPKPEPTLKKKLKLKKKAPESLEDIANKYSRNYKILNPKYDSLYNQAKKTNMLERFFSDGELGNHLSAKLNYEGELNKKKLDIEALKEDGKYLDSLDINIEDRMDEIDRRELNEKFADLLRK